MAITSVALNLSLLLLLAVLATRVIQPWAPPPRGRVIHREPLLLLGRLRMFGPPGLVLLVVSGIGWWLGRVSAIVFDVMVIGLVALVAMPVGYTLTTRGIALGRTIPRRWTEFGGIGRQRWGVRLQGVAGGRGMRVLLSGGRDDDAFVLLLRKMVRGSYQGWVDRAEVTASPPAVYADAFPNGAAGFGD